MSPDRSVEQELRVLEESLLEADVRASAAKIKDLLADEFVEFGASGRVYDRCEVLGSLRAESSVRRSLTDFRVRLLAPGVALATYRAERRGEHGKRAVRSLRSSVWKHVGDRWQLVFHQGTSIPEEPS
jgi:glyoxylase I family protein